MVRILRPGGYVVAGEGPEVDGVGETERAKLAGCATGIATVDRSGRLDGPAIGISGPGRGGFGWGGLSLCFEGIQVYTKEIVIMRLTSAYCRLRSNLSLSACVIAVLEVSLSSGVRTSSNKPFGGSSSLLSSLSFPFPWTGNLNRTTIRRGGDSGGRGGVIFSCGRLIGEECPIALRVTIRVRPRGRRGDPGASM